MPPSPLAHRFAPMWNPDFRRLFVARFVTTLGSWGTFIAVLSLYVFHTRIGPLAVGAFAVVQLLPNIFADPIASVVTDRISRRRILIITKVLSGMIVLLLLLGHSLLLAYTVLFLLQLVASLSGPATQALLPQVVVDDELEQANGLLSGAKSVAQITAPGIAGILIAVFRPQIVFILDALTFGISAVFIFSMTEYSVERDDPVSFLADFKEGVRYVHHSPELIRGMLVGLMLSVAAGVINAMMPLYIREVLHGGAILFGSILSITSAGAVVAGIAISGSKRQLHALSGATLALGLAGAALVGISFIHLPIIVGAIMVVAGFARTSTNIYVTTHLQQSAQEATMGRIFGILNAAVGIGRFGSIIVGSLLVAQVGVIPVFAGVGGLLIVSGSGIFVSRMI